MKTETQFFYEQAGWSYDPKTETSEQGRRRCAELLANVERHARSSGIRYEWELDDITSEDFSDERPFYKLWVCIAYKHGEVIASLCGIDFGRNKKPHGEPYKRVVEAELAFEDYIETQESQRCACADIATV